MITKFAIKEYKKGFTLLELMIVIAIISLLAAVAIPQFASYQQRGYMALTKSDVRNAHTAIQNYIAENLPGPVPAVSTTGPAALDIPYESARVSSKVTITVATDGSVTGIHADYTGYKYCLDAQGAPIETIP